jgi:hypothetical protein
MADIQEYIDQVKEIIKDKLFEEDYSAIIISGNRMLIGLGDIEDENEKLIPSNIIFELSIRDVTDNINSIL